MMLLLAPRFHHFMVMHAMQGSSSVTMDVNTVRYVAQAILAHVDLLEAVSATVSTTPRDAMETVSTVLLSAHHLTTKATAATVRAWTQNLTLFTEILSPAKVLANLLIMSAGADVILLEHIYVNRMSAPTQPEEGAPCTPFIGYFCGCGSQYSCCPFDQICYCFSNDFAVECHEFRFVYVCVKV